MKKILLTLIAFMFVATAAARPESLLRLGIKAGVSSQFQHVSGHVHFNDHTINNPSTGYHVGLMVRFSIPLLPIYLQPELVYTWQEYKFRNTHAFTEDVSCFDLPILVGAGIGLGGLVRLRANVGPVITLSTDGHFDGTETYTTVVSRPRVGYTVGIGADILRRLTVDVRFNGQFRSSPQLIDMHSGHDTIAVENVQTRFKSWTFSIGYLF